ncbi:unnamed protein product [Owenia fusiformis]|uniref:Uncharacterized protein n=1 Tax=Owenia fusiformis TaxID=6347 RepID=A0A8J1XL62_OWEFU|nr:unnamed protein product [Owenia fusiformis]
MCLKLLGTFLHFLVIVAAIPCDDTDPVFQPCLDNYFGPVAPGEDALLCVDPFTGGEVGVCDEANCNCSSGVIDASETFRRHGEDLIGLDSSTLTGSAKTAFDEVLEKADMAQIKEETSVYILLANEEALILFVRGLSGGTFVCQGLSQLMNTLWNLKTAIDDAIVVFDALPQQPATDAILKVYRENSNFLNWMKIIYFPKILDLLELECTKDDHCGDRHKPYCIVGMDQCFCSAECRNDNDCNELSKPNCRSNRAGIMICGDPHVSQTIKGTHHRLCYDFYGKPGATYMFLKDRAIEVVATFIDAKNITAGSFVEYVGTLGIKMGETHILITPTKIQVNMKETKTYYWVAQKINLDIGWISVTRKQLHVFIEEADVKVKVLVTRKGKASGLPFLNFGITEIEELSESAEGIMGSIGNEAMFHAARDNDGFVTWSDITIPVKLDKQNCVKIVEHFRGNFTDRLQEFEIMDAYGYDINWNDMNENDDTLRYDENEISLYADDDDDDENDEDSVIA